MYTHGSKLSIVIFNKLKKGLHYKIEVIFRVRNNEVVTNLYKRLIKVKKFLIWLFFVLYTILYIYTFADVYDRIETLNFSAIP